MTDRDPIPADPDPAPGPPVLRWGLVAFGAGWLAMVLVGALSFGLTCAAGGHPADRCQDELGGVALFAAQLPAQTVALAVPLLASRYWGSGRPDRDLDLRAQWRDLPEGAGVGLATQLAALPALYWVITRLTGDLDVGGAARELLERVRGDPEAVAVMVLTVCVVAPLAEEMLYRGLLMTALSQRMSAPAALVVQAAVFATAHFQAVQWPGLFLFGLVAGWLRLRSRRLGASVAAHAAFNAVTVVSVLA